MGYKYINPILFVFFELIGEASEFKKIELYGGITKKANFWESLEMTQEARKYVNKYEAMAKSEKMKNVDPVDWAFLYRFISHKILYTTAYFFKLHIPPKVQFGFYIQKKMQTPKNIKKSDGI